MSVDRSLTWLVFFVRTGFMYHMWQITLCMNSAIALYLLLLVPYLYWTAVDAEETCSSSEYVFGKDDDSMWLAALVIASPLVFMVQGLFAYELGERTASILFECKFLSTHSMVVLLPLLL
jgi:hypothetical protein